jgi:riboflavin biosynthesis pyrimidine reductase
MAVIASLVVGSNHATSKNGLSSPLSTPADRERFLERHRGAAAFIIGKKSAAIESYRSSKVPIFIFSRNTTPLDFEHPLMQQVTVDRNLYEITRIIDYRIDGDIVVEAGHSLLMALVKVGAVDLMELSLSPIAGDGDFIDLDELLDSFEIVSDKNVDGTRLLECRYQGNSTNS